jgi:hypothetical protein
MVMGGSWSALQSFCASVRKRERERLCVCVCVCVCLRWNVDSVRCEHLRCMRELVSEWMNTIRTYIHTCVVCVCVCINTQHTNSCAAWKSLVSFGQANGFYIRMWMWYTHIQTHAFCMSACMCLFGMVPGESATSYGLAYSPHATCVDSSRLCYKLFLLPLPVCMYACMYVCMLVPISRDCATRSLSCHFMCVCMCVCVYLCMYVNENACVSSDYELKSK